MDLPFRVEYLDAKQMLPVLMRKAARKVLRELRRAAPYWPACARRATTPIWNAGL